MIPYNSSSSQPLLRLSEKFIFSFILEAKFQLLNKELINLQKKSGEKPKFFFISSSNRKPRKSSLYVMEIVTPCRNIYKHLSIPYFAKKYIFLSSKKVVLISYYCMWKIVLAFKVTHLPIWSLSKFDINHIDRLEVSDRLHSQAQRCTDKSVNPIGYSSWVFILDSARVVCADSSLIKPWYSVIQDKSRAEIIQAAALSVIAIEETF